MATPSNNLYGDFDEDGNLIQQDTGDLYADVGGAAEMRTAAPVGLYDDIDEDGWSISPPVAETPAPSGEEPGAGDYGRVLMSGLAATGGMAAGLGEYAANMVGADTVRDWLGSARKASQDASEYWSAGMSDAGKRDQEKKYASMGEDAAWKDLDSVMFTILGALPSTVVTMGPAGVAARTAYAATLAKTAGSAAAKKAAAVAAAAKAATVTGFTTEGALGAGSIAADVTATLESMKPGDLAKLEEYQKLKKEFPNMSEEDLRLGVIANATRWTAAIGGVVTGAVGAVAGPLEARLFTEGAGFLSRVAKGALSEGAQEGAQAPAETIPTNIALEKPVTEGLLENTIASIVGGAGAGGPIAGVTGGGTDTPSDAPSPLADLERVQNEARADAAARGGDNLDQELAAAMAGAETGIQIDEAVKSNHDRIREMQRLVDEETAYAETQKKEDAARAKIQEEAAKRYEEGLMKIDEGKKTAQAKNEIASTVEESAARVKTEKFQAAKAARQEEKAAIQKAEKAREADAKLNKLQQRRIELGLAKPNEGGGPPKPPPSAAGILKEPEVKAKLEKGKTPDTAMALALKKAAAAAKSAPAEQSTTTPEKQTLAPVMQPAVKVADLPIKIENPIGSIRKGVDPEGKEWSTSMKDHYGYIERTSSAEGKNEELDAFIGPDTASDNVFIVDAMTRDGEFDEHKAMVGYPNELAARRAYARNYPKGHKIGPVSTMGAKQFKEWLKSGDQTVPLQPDKFAGATPASAEQLEEEVIRQKSRKGGRRARILYRQGDEGSSDTLSKTLETSGGFTVDNKTGQPVNKGFAVSIKGAERKIEGHATTDQIESYRRDHAVELAQPGNHLGAWYNEEDGKTYLDVSKVVPTQAEAEKAGRENEQLAVANLETGDVISLKKTQQKESTLKVTSADLKEINRVLNDPNGPRGGFRGYRKEVALRANMDGPGESFNYALYEDSDLADQYQLKDLVGRDIETTAEGIVELDVWLYRGDELYDTVPVYIARAGKGTVVSFDKPDSAAILRAAVKSAATKPMYRLTEEIEAAPAPAEAPTAFTSKTMKLAELEGVPGDPMRKNLKEMREFTQKIKSGEIKPMVIVKTENGKPVRIVEGNHTLRAFKALGRTDVTVRLQEGGTNVATKATTEEGVPGRGELPGGGGLVEIPRRPRAARQPNGDLAGLPNPVKTAEGQVERHHWSKGESVARKYMEAAGLPYNPPAEYVAVDKERAARIADEFEKMEHNPQDPPVREAYSALIQEAAAQYQFALDSGLKVEFVPEGQPDPYGNPQGVIDDVRDNNHMWVFSTRAGFGSSETFDPVDNPLLIETPFKISGQTALANDIFRVVHDYFGHIKEGVGFRANGEENAWRAHSAMFSPLARKALTTETRGQNSWLNFGPYGETNRTAKTEDTHFADQKIGLLPDWVVYEGASDETYEESVAPDSAFEGETVEAVHYSRVPGLSTLEGSRYGTGIRGQEAARLSDPDYADIRHRVYIYTGEHRKEVGLGAEKYTWTQDNLYNLDKDPLAFRRAAKEVYKEQGAAGDTAGIANEMDRMIKNAGFSGVYSPRQNGTGYVFGDVKVSAQKRDVRYRQGTLEGVETGTAGAGIPRLHETKAFKKWFGKSKVKDSKGKPMVVYHGTSADFSAFEKKPGFITILFSTMETMRHAFFFTPNKKAAETFAVQHADPGRMPTGANLMPVYLSIENPIYLNRAMSDSERAALEGAGVDPRVFENFYGEAWELFDEASGESNVEALKRAGFDGAVLEEDDVDTGKTFKAWVAFDPEQIKSAIGNRGTFDPTDPNILYRQGQTGELTQAHAERALEGLVSKLPLLQPTILANASEAPEEIYQQMKDDGALGAKGVYIPSTDRLYLFAENHSSVDDLIKTLLHEGVGHKGLRYLLGERFPEVMRDVYENGDKIAMAKIARKYGLDLKKPADQMIAAEEYIAHTAEGDIESGILQRVIDAVRQVLRELGIISAWNDSDIKALLRDARRSLRGVPLSKIRITSEARIKETGEVVEISEPADRVLRQINKRMAVLEKLRICIS